MFKAELFNATEWASLFSLAGAKYIVPTSKVILFHLTFISKHHEGYTLWKSAQSW